MQALRKVAAEKGLALEDVPDPRPSATDVIVEVEAASVCGTDLHIHLWDGWAAGRVQPPVTLGHEFAGTVVEVGADVRHVVGRRLRLRGEPHHLWRLCRVQDGQCPYVRMDEHSRRRPGRRLRALCERPGERDLEDGSDKASARDRDAPRAVRQCRLRDERAGPLRPHRRGLGCGPVGLFTIAIARASGAARILASDLHPFRLGLASTMGADGIVDVSEVADAAGWFAEQTDGHGADVVFEMSGSPIAIGDAIRTARNGGRVILFGIPSRHVEVDVATAIFKNLTVQAVSGRRIFATWYRTRWLLESGAVDLRPLITHEYSLDDWEQVFTKLEAGEACKIVVYPAGLPGGPRRLQRSPRFTDDDRSRGRTSTAQSAPSSTLCARRGRTSGSTRSSRRRGLSWRWTGGARCSSSRRTTTSGLQHGRRWSRPGSKASGGTAPAPAPSASSAGRSSRTSSSSASSPTSSAPRPRSRTSRAGTRTRRRSRRSSTTAP